MRGPADAEKVRNETRSNAGNPKVEIRIRQDGNRKKEWEPGIAEFKRGDPTGPGSCGSLKERVRQKDLKTEKLLCREILLSMFLRVAWRFIEREPGSGWIEESQRFSF